MREFEEYLYLDRGSPSGLRWKRNRGRLLKGSIAGSSGSTKGYWKVKLNYKSFCAHRVIALMSGLLTVEEFNDLNIVIDHRDGDGLNNELTNLRKTDQRGNACNQKIHRAGHLFGTSKKKDANRSRPWQARITIQGTRSCLGYFKTEQEAHEAYLKASERI